MGHAVIVVLGDLQRAFEMIDLHILIKLVQILAGLPQGVRLPCFLLNLVSWAQVGR